MKLNSVKLSWDQAAFVALCTLFAGMTFSTALVEIGFFSALVLWIFWKCGSKPFRLVEGWHAGFWALGAFVVFCSLSWFWSDFKPQSGKGILKYLQDFFLFWIAADILGRAERRSFFERLLTALYFVLMLDAGWQYMTGRDFIRGFAGEPASSGYRLTASFKTYGLFAAFLAVTLPAMGAMAWEAFKQKRSMLERVLYSVLTAGGIFALFLTRSRGAMLAFAGSLMCLLVLKRQWRLIFMLAALLAGLFFVLPRGMIIHLDADNREQSLVERYYLWDRAVNVIRAKPIGGTGINTYAVAHAKYDKTQNWRVRNYYAHNGYLQIGAETGLVGLGLFLAGLWFLIRCAILRLRAATSPVSSNRGWAILTGVFAFLIMSLVDTVMHNNQSVLLFWLWLGLLEAASRDAR